MLGPVSDSDRISSQQKCLAVLAEVLVDARGRDLPCVHWEVGTAHTIVARCVQRDDTERMAAFTAWAGYFQMSDRKQWESDGFTHLQGNRTGFRGCTVVVVADLRLTDPMARPGARR